MSPKLPIVTPSELIRAFERSGFVRFRSKGSHLIYKHHDLPGRYVCIPFHRKDLSQRTLSMILDQAGLTVDQLLEMLRT